MTKKKLRYISTNKGDIDKEMNVDKLQQDPVECIKKIVILTVVGIIIIASCSMDIHFLFTKPSYPYEDILEELPNNNVNAKMVKKYINYLVDKVKIRGIQDIHSKWASDVPGDFKKLANSKFTTIGSEGFIIQKVCYDKKNVYCVKCIANTAGKEVIFFDITKEILPNGDSVFRLLKVY